MASDGGDAHGRVPPLGPILAARHEARKARTSGSRTIHRRALLALPGVGALPAAAQESSPSRPIRLIVPFATGGPSDIVARLLAPKMSAVLGQPVVVEAHAGAGGVTGLDAVAKAAPNGHVIGLGSAGGLAISPGLPQPMPYDTLRDFAPLTLAVIVHERLVVPAKMPWQNLDELIAAPKADPGKLNFGATGPGSMPHLAGAARVEWDLLQLGEAISGADAFRPMDQGGCPQVRTQARLGREKYSLSKPLPSFL